MYLPSFKYKGNLFTEGDEYSIEGSELPYVGSYFITVTGEVFSGNKPGDGANNRLVQYIKPVGGANSTKIERYDLVRQKEIETQLKDTLPVPIYYPKPGTEKTLTRYFAIDKTTQRVVEVSKDTYLSIKSKEPKYYYPKYDLKTLTWSLTNASENRVNAAIAGLDSYLKDPSQFVR